MTMVKKLSKIQYGIINYNKQYDSYKNVQYMIQ
jgi:hypothetical protein